MDDNSIDGTAAAARTVAAGASNLLVLSGQPKPADWSGKLWAMQQGVQASTALLLLLTDADIVHASGHVWLLVVHLLSARVNLVSEMVRLNCVSLAEHALVTAFVYFFQMLYPFARVDDSRSTVAAAAGGTMLLRRATLAELGGLQAIQGRAHRRCQPCQDGQAPWADLSGSFGVGAIDPAVCAGGCDLGHDLACRPLRSCATPRCCCC